MSDNGLIVKGKLTALLPQSKGYVAIWVDVGDEGQHELIEVSCRDQARADEVVGASQIGEQISFRLYCWKNRDGRTIQFFPHDVSPSSTAPTRPPTSRSFGANPRALGTNPRAKQAELEAAQA